MGLLAGFRSFPFLFFDYLVQVMLDKWDKSG